MSIRNHLSWGLSALDQHTHDAAHRRALEATSVCPALPPSAWAYRCMYPPRHLASENAHTLTTEASERFAAALTSCARRQSLTRMSCTSPNRT